MAGGDPTDTEWRIIEGLLPTERGRKSRPARDNRQYLNGNACMRYEIDKGRCRSRTWKRPGVRRSVPRLLSKPGDIPGRARSPQCGDPRVRCNYTDIGPNVQLSYIVEG